MPELYDPSFEHDACGVGIVADLTGQPSRATVDDALTILENLEHRGATGSDPDSGDGAGILVQMPDALIRRHFRDVPLAGQYGVVQWMVPASLDWTGARRDIDLALGRVGLASGGWRHLEVNSSLLGRAARASEPGFVQELVVPVNPMATEDL